MDSDARFIFANFEDFDMLYGHRSDAVGFSRSIEEFDAFLGEFLSKSTEEDLILITADHGNDPTDASTDHTREYVPIVVIQHGLAGRNLGTTDGMGQIADAIAHHLGVRDVKYPSLLIM
jgi:phosphopentomutase